MTDVINIEIADTNFSVSCQTATLLNELEPSYQSFVRTDKNPATIDIAVRLSLKDIPNTGKFIKICDSGQSWSMFRDGDDCLLSFYPSSTKKQPLWLARFRPNISTVTVHCSKRLMKKRVNGVSLINPFSYPLDQLMLMYVLAKRGGALVHAAGIKTVNKGFIFLGRSGAGKSTLSSILKDSKHLELLSDDRIAVRKTDGVFKAYGTPWPGDLGIAVNKNVPLSGIFFIYHGSTNTIKKIYPQQALKKLFPVTSIPWYDPPVLDRIFAFCEDLITKVPSYELHFKPHVEVISTLEKFIST